LVLSDGNEMFSWLTIDAAGANGMLMQMAYDMAVGMGFSGKFESLMVSASNTHSGPGGIIPEFFWSVAPASDIVVPDLQFQIANSMAKALIDAERNLQPAVIEIGIGQLTGVTYNNRAGFSPYVNESSIDPNLSVIRIDKTDGSPLATVWNYAVHGICFTADNMLFSGDIMGSVNQYIESQLGGISLFINGDSGDVDPITSSLCQNPPNFSGGPVIGKKILEIRAGLRPTGEVQLHSAQQQVNFGLTETNLTLARVDNCTQGGPLDICTICRILDCDLNIEAGSGWLENMPYFSAFGFLINGKSTVVVSIPGEALVALGNSIRADMSTLGFNQTILAGFSNAGMGYFCPPNEYSIGGYQCILTFWGIDTSNKVQESCAEVAAKIAPVKF